MIENAIQYFKERIDVEKQICNLPTCDEWFKKKKLRNIEYMSLAIQALEKQIPQKPIGDIKEDAGQCPICKEYVNDYFGGRMKYCRYCGQLIDWKGEQNG